MVAKMKLVGGQKLAKKLSAIPKRIADDVARATTKGAEEIASLQRSLAPVKSGKLKRSIHVTPPGQSTPPYSQPGGSRVAGETESIITAGDSEVRYAHLVEYGTAEHPNKGMFEGTQNPGTTAQPFFWPGYRLGRKRAASRIKRETSKAIKKEFGR